MLPLGLETIAGSIITFLHKASLVIVLHALSRPERTDNRITRVSTSSTYSILVHEGVVCVNPGLVKGICPQLNRAQSTCYRNAERCRAKNAIMPGVVSICSLPTILKASISAGVSSFETIISPLSAKLIKLRSKSAS